MSVKNLIPKRTKSSKVIKVSGSCRLLDVGDLVTFRIKGHKEYGILIKEIATHWELLTTRGYTILASSEIMRVHSYKMN